jgi:hypothetical protein
MEARLRVIKVEEKRSFQAYRSSNFSIDLHGSGPPRKMDCLWHN